MAKTLSDKKIAAFIADVQSGAWHKQATFLALLKSLENRKILFEFPVCSNKCAKTYGNNPSLICDNVD